MLSIDFSSQNKSKRLVFFLSISVLALLPLSLIGRINGLHALDHTNVKEDFNSSLIQKFELKLMKVLGNASIDNKKLDQDLISYAWLRMEQEYGRYLQFEVNRSRQLVEHLLVKSNVSKDCNEAVLSWLKGIANLDGWAVQMWTSWGKFPPAGLFEGSFSDLGSYKGCLGVKNNKIIDQPQYCSLDFQPLIPTRPRFHSIFKRILDVQQDGHITGGDYSFREGLTMSKLASHTYSSNKFKVKEENHIDKNSTGDKQGLKTELIKEFARIAQYFYYVHFRIGSCWPSKCSKSDIQKISQTGGALAVLQATEVTCVLKSDLKLKINKYQWVSIVILGSFAIITILATIIDTLFLAYNSLLSESSTESTLTIQKLDTYLDVFSLIRNWKRLMSPSLSPTNATTTAVGKQKSASPKQLSCVHGVRFISMIWVVYGHTVLNTDYHSLTHAFQALEQDITNIFILPTLNGNFSVDTFFLVSGLLSAYIIFSVDIKFNAFFYIVARYARLTPQLIIIILLFFLLPLAGDGPLYRQGTDVHAERCYKNFWVDLLYLQSYINRKDLCIIPSWWLSIEMTFTIMSLFIIPVLFKKPKLGLALNFLVTLMMSLIGVYIHYANGFAIAYLPSILQKYEVEMEQTHWFFHRPYPHAASYFIGFSLGFILAKKYIVRLTKLQQLFGWLICSLGFIIPLWTIYYWNLGAPYTQLQASLYYNLCQVLWPLSMGWVILACTLGYGGIINDILSAKLFVPLGRITYMTYLSHILIVYFYAASFHQTLELNALNLVSVRM